MEKHRPPLPARLRAGRLLDSKMDAMREFLRSTCRACHLGGVMTLRCEECGRRDCKYGNPGKGEGGEEKVCGGGRGEGSSLCRRLVDALAIPLAT